MFHFQRSVLFVCCICGVAIVQLQAADQFSLKKVNSEYLDIVMSQGQPVLRYVFARDTSTPERTFETAKVFAHVMASDGISTLTNGPDGEPYPHHRGIFLGWSKLKHGGKDHDLWHTRDTAQVHQKFVEIRADGDGASITSLIDWIGNHGERVIEETRTYRVAGQDEVHAVIDFFTELKAVNGDVELNGDPEHAGIQFRPSQQVAENESAKYVFHEVGIDPRKQLDLPWVAATFRVDDQAWTVQHMSHPGNPRGARWSAYRNYGRFGPFTVVNIPAGQVQVFRYRFRVASGESPSREQLADQYERYLKGLD